MIWPNASDAVIVDHEDAYIVVQSADKAYVFGFSEGYDDGAMQWMVFNTCMGGTELYDIYMYEIWPDDDTEYTSGWAEYERVDDVFYEFQDSMWVLWAETGDADTAEEAEEASEEVVEEAVE